MLCNLIDQELNNYKTLKSDKQRPIYKPCYMEHQNVGSQWEAVYRAP